MIRHCPVCLGNQADTVLEYVPREFDQCELSMRSLVKTCRDCGMVFVDHGIAPEAIRRFYEEHSLYSSDATFGTGGSTPADLERYAWYSKLLADSGARPDSIVADVGCGKGGFLAHLKSAGYGRLCAVEVDPRCAEIAREQHGADVRVGSADQIPFADSSIDVLVAAQVMEHLDDVHKSLKECYRVLRPDGLLLIEVPDTSRYATTRLYDFAWVALMEHVNHFTPHSLAQVLQSEGFQVITTNQSDRTIHDIHKYPSLCVVGRKSDAPSIPYSFTNDFHALAAMTAHVATERDYAAQRKVWLESLFTAASPIACWGISREFFNLVRFSGLDPSRLFGLYDRNQQKLKLTVSGKPVMHPDTVPFDRADLTIILTSVLHADAIRADLAQRGFKGTARILEQ